jgi:hypothetical protein
MPHCTPTQGEEEGEGKEEKEEKEKEKKERYSLFKLFLSNDHEIFLIHPKPHKLILLNISYFHSNMCFLLY